MGQVSIFRHGSVGRVAVILGDNATKFITITLQPPFGADNISNTGNNRLSGLIVSCELEKMENASLTPTLGKSIYLYVGGESAYVIRVVGTAFRNCKNNNNGLDQIISWYENANVKKTGKACKIILNSKVFKGYLKQFSLSASPKLDNTAAFSLTFYGILA